MLRNWFLARYRRLLIVLVMCVAFVPSTAESANQPIELSGWIIEPLRFLAVGPASFEAAAHRQGSVDRRDTIMITVEQRLDGPWSHYALVDKERLKLEQRELPGIGLVQVAVESGPGIMQIVNPPEMASVFLVYEQAGKGIVLERRVAETRDSTTKVSFAQDLRAKILDGLEAEPLVQLLRVLCKERVVLAKYTIASDIQSLEAAIGDAEFVSIPPEFGNIDRLGGNGEWRLAVKPGESAQVRLRMRAALYTTWSDGTIEADEAAGFASLPVRVDSQQVAVDPAGVVLASFPPFPSTTMLKLTIEGWLRSYTDFEGKLYIRLPQHDEASSLPVSTGVSEERLQRTIRLVLEDLERELSTSSRTIYTPGKWIHPADVFDGLDLSAFPSLTAATRFFSSLPPLEGLAYAVTGLWITTDGTIGSSPIDASTFVQQVFPMIRGYAGMPESSSPEVGKAWPTPWAVRQLALFWSAAPSLRDQSRLQEILDDWVLVLREQPDPIFSMLVGKDPNPVREIRRDIASRADAVAALELGARLLGKPEYGLARDIQIDRLRDDMRELGFFDAMIAKEKWQATEFHEELHRMPEAVFLYGQLCRFTGDEQGFQAAQDWIQSAVLMDGPAGIEPHKNYEAAFFADRCGLVDVLRGRASYFKLPAYALPD